MTVVLPVTANVPPTLLSVTPFVVLFDELMLSIVTPSVPVSRFNARPVPEIANSVTVSVPKLLPEMAEPAAASRNHLRQRRQL